MAIIKKDDIAPQRPVIILIYGEPGSGKTSVANTAESTIMCDCDRGFDRAAVRVDTITANKWEDIIQDEGEFKNYKTISLDTCRSALDDYLIDYVCRKDYKLKSNKQRMYGAIGEEFKAFVNRRRSESNDLIFVAHAAEEKSKDLVRYSPDITGQSKNLLLRIADQVGYIFMENKKRYICFDPSDEYTGKNVAEIPKTEIPDKNSPEFATFMADIIKKVKSSISSKSEAQRKAQAQLEEATEKLNAAKTVDDANELISVANSLPKPMQSAFKKKVAEEMKKLGFVVKDGKFVKE